MSPADGQRGERTVHDALTALKTRYGARWLIWVVPLAAGGETWCARRHGDDVRHVLNAHTPEHLGEYIAQAETERSSGAQATDAG
jgi:hypothetical protein